MLSRFSIFGFWQSDYDVSECAFEFILLGICWTSWMCRFIPFSKLGHFLPLYLQIFFLPSFPLFFWGSHVYVGPFGGVPQVPLEPLLIDFFFFSFFFLLLSLDNCIWTLLKFTAASVCSHLWLKPSSKFFCFSYCTFWLQIGIWLLLLIWISLLIFSTYRYIILLVSFNSLSMISFCSLSVFKTVDLKSCLVRPLSMFSQGHFLLHFLCTYEWTMLSCFFACFVLFCWKLDILNNMMYLEEERKQKQTKKVFCGSLQISSVLGRSSPRLLTALP